MVSRVHKFGFFLSLLALGACTSSQASQENLDWYESQLEIFEETQDVDAICNAARIIGNSQQQFPLSDAERKKLFIQHIKTGLDVALKQGLSDKTSSCSGRLETDLYVAKTAIINQNRDMVACLDSNRVNGLYTSDAYDACVKLHNYIP